ncbi:hypothetical protein [Sulfitobacter sp. R18_1]|uniref:hypothetical protein n=1 Tax=Sulfitobacter sp. R18_1 TaxID=2821104 RepID=UPI001ADA68D9|nr:hypothetical protein [Sulfitobacter sp. R18_1]MBO9428738.1 hypothetical protein [Sulfitobacter sp. R18_1]
MSRTYRRSQLSRSVEGQYRWLNGLYNWSLLSRPSEEEIWAEAKLDYRHSIMDGRYAESGRRKAFKKKCARHLRRQNAIYCRNAADEDYYDEAAAPRRQDTTRFVWDFF